jgi:hypothetical protein
MPVFRAGRKPEAVHGGQDGYFFIEAIKTPPAYCLQGQARHKGKKEKRKNLVA